MPEPPVLAISDETDQGIIKQDYSAVVFLHTQNYSITTELVFFYTKDSIFYTKVIIQPKGFHFKY